MSLSVCDFCRCTAVRIDVLLECVMCYDPSLHQTIHPIIDSDIYVSVKFLAE